MWVAASRWASFKFDSKFSIFRFLNFLLILAKNA